MIESPRIRVVTSAIADKIVGTLLSFLVGVLLMRSLGAELYGKYGLIVIYYSILLLTGMFGQIQIQRTKNCGYNIVQKTVF